MLSAGLKPKITATEQPPGSAPNIIRVTKLRGARWVGHAASLVEMGNIHNILLANFKRINYFCV
jgi:hypothetical protein